MLGRCEEFSKTNVIFQFEVFEAFDIFIHLNQLIFIFMIIRYLL